MRFAEWHRLPAGERADALVRAALRALRQNPSLCSFVELQPVNAGHRDGPLAYLPYAAKDLFMARGHLPRCGLTNPINLSSEYATLLKLFDDAGAVRIGFTAMTELAYEPSGYNAVAPYPRNPWNFNFITGGSSSGSAVAVASGSATIAIGTDTGGSIRIPAHCCGVTGWKSTWGALAMDGVMPLAPFLDCLGLLARCAADIAMVADVIAPEIPAVNRIERIVIADDAIRQSDLATRNACESAVAVLVATGHRTIARDVLPFVEKADPHSLTIMQGEAARSQGHWLNNLDLSPILRKRLAKGLEIDEEKLRESCALRSILVREFEDSVLGDADAVLLPVMPILTPRYAEVDPTSDRFKARTLYQLSAYCRFVNVLGLPAVAFPAGFDDNEMPIALQLLGRSGSDRDLIALAGEYQVVTEWHARVPPGIAHLIETETEIVP